MKIQISLLVMVCLIPLLSVSVFGAGYENAEHGFRIAYPSDWSIVEKRGGEPDVQFNYKKLGADSFMNINLVSNPYRSPDLPPEEYLAQMKSQFSSMCPPSSGCSNLIIEKNVAVPMFGNTVHMQIYKYTIREDRNTFTEWMGFTEIPEDGKTWAIISQFRQDSSGNPHINYEAAVNSFRSLKMANYEQEENRIAAEIAVEQKRIFEETLPKIMEFKNQEVKFELIESKVFEYPRYNNVELSIKITAKDIQFDEELSFSKSRFVLVDEESKSYEKDSSDRCTNEKYIPKIDGKITDNIIVKKCYATDKDVKKFTVFFKPLSNGSYSTKIGYVELDKYLGNQIPIQTNEMVENTPEIPQIINKSSEKDPNTKNYSDSVIQSIRQFFNSLQNIFKN